MWSLPETGNQFFTLLYLHGHVVTKSFLYTLSSAVHAGKMRSNHESSGRLEETKNNKKNYKTFTPKSVRGHLRELPMGFEWVSLHGVWSHHVMLHVVFSPVVPTG